MINMYDYKGIALLNDSSPETVKTKLFCMTWDIPYKMYYKNQIIDTDYVPVGGSVEWCQKQLGRVIIPDYYPSWIYLNRKIWYQDNLVLSVDWLKGNFLDKKVFIKPADRYKRFKGCVVTKSQLRKKKPPFYCSEVVNFTDEFRYYISNGKVKESAWYWGVEDNITPPDIEAIGIKIPSNYCGAVDFGYLDDNKTFTLIEAHHPFACGWYGDKIENYIQWCIDGWRYLNG